MTPRLDIPAWLMTSKANLSLVKEAAWLTDFREKHWEKMLQHGWLTRKQARFKYTDVSFLAEKNFHLSTPLIAHARVQEAVVAHRLENSVLWVFINGHFAPTYSDTFTLPHGIIACRLQDALQQHQALVKAHWPHAMEINSNPMIHVNAAFFTDGLFLWIPKKVSLTQPVHLLFVNVGEQEWMAHPHHLIVMEDQSELTLFEEAVDLTETSYFMNSVHTMTIGKEASLQHHVLQTIHAQAIQLHHRFIRQQQDSRFNFTHFSRGSLWSRDESVLHLEARGAMCQASGFYSLKENDRVMDHHLTIRHLAPYSQSDVLYKGVLDQASRAIFHGRVYAEKEAQKMLAYQANHHLLLSPQAEAYSQPELEIYADDVKCKHGASSGQIDHDRLFYLRSRGIPYHDAITLLTQGFAADILQRIAHAAIQKRVQERILC